MNHFLKNLIWPATCTSCKEILNDSNALLCPHCMDELILINPLSRCPYCFSDEIDGEKKVCEACRKKRGSLDYIAAAFDYHGPAKSLVLSLKYRDRPYLCKSLAAFLFLQFHELQWEEPDVITYVPQSFSRFLDRGYNQSELLAKEFSALIKRPFLPLLKKNGSSISQTQLELKDRKRLLSHSFSATKPEDIEDKVLLLLDDVYTTGTTLECCASALQTHHPKRIYALTLCRS